MRVAHVLSLRSLAQAKADAEAEKKRKADIEAERVKYEAERKKLEAKLASQQAEMERLSTVERDRSVRIGCCVFSCTCACVHLCHARPNSATRSGSAFVTDLCCICSRTAEEERKKFERELRAQHEKEVILSECHCCDDVDLIFACCHRACAAAGDCEAVPRAEADGAPGRARSRPGLLLCLPSASRALN